MADEDNINVQATGDASGLVSAMQQSVAASQALLAAVAQLNTNLAATTATTAQTTSGLGQTSTAAKATASQFVGLGQAVAAAAAQTVQATNQGTQAVNAQVPAVNGLQAAWNSVVTSFQGAVAGIGSLNLSLDALQKGIDVTAAHGRTLSIAMDAVGFSAGEASAKVLAGLGALTSGLSKALGPFLAVAVAVTGVVAAVDLFKASVGASADYAAALDRLRVAVEAAGGAFDTVKPKIEEWLELQRQTTTFDPVELINGLTKLREAGLTVGQAMQSMRVAEDVAAGSGKSLADVAQALAQTYDGRTRALTQLNVATRESIAAGTNYAAVLQALEDHYGSQATAAVDTYRGAHEQLDNAITNLEKDVGDKLTPGLIDLTHHLTEFVDKLDETKASEIGQWFLDVANMALTLASAVGKVSDALQVVENLISGYDSQQYRKNIGDFFTTPQNFFGGSGSTSGGLAQSILTSAVTGAKGSSGQLQNPVDLSGLPTTEVGGPTDESKKKKAEEEAKKAAEDRFHTQMAYIEELRANNQTNYQEEITQLQDLAAHYATTAQERYEVETKIGEVRREGIAQAIEGEKKIAEAQKQTLTTYEENAIKAIEIKHNAEIAAGKNKQQADAEELASLKTLASTELFTDAQKLDITLKIGDLKKTFAEQDKEAARQAQEAAQKAITDADDLIIRQLKLGGVLAANAAIEAKGILSQVGPPSVDDEKNYDAVLTALQEYYAKDAEVSAKVIENQTKVETAAVDANSKIGASRDALHIKILQMAIDELKAQQAQYAAMGSQGKQAYDDLQKIIDADSLEIEKNIADIKKAYQDYIDSATKQTASLIDDLVIKHKSLKSELSTIYDQILQAYVSMIAKMIVESKLFQQVFPFMGGSGSSSSQGGIFGGFISSVTGGGNSSKPDGSAGNPIYVTTADITAQAAQKLTGSTTGVAVGSITNIANTTPPASGDLSSSPENAWGMASGAASGSSPASNALAKTIGNSVAGAITGASLGTTAASILNPGGNQQMAGDFSAVAGAVGAHLMLVNPLLGAGIMVGAGLLGSLFGPHETAAEQPDINDPTWGSDLVNWQGASATVNGQILQPGSQYNTSNGGTSQASQFSDWVAGEANNVSALTPAQQQLYTQIVGLMGGNPNAGAGGLDITAEHQGNVYFANGQSMSVTAFEQLVSNFGTTVGTTIGNLLIPIFDVQHALPDYAGASVTAAGTYTLPTTASGTTAPTGTGSTNPVTNASGAGVVVNVSGSVIASEDLATQLATIVGNGVFSHRSAAVMDYV